MAGVLRPGAGVHEAAVRRPVMKSTRYGIFRFCRILVVRVPLIAVCFLIVQFVCATSGCQDNPDPPPPPPPDAGQTEEVAAPDVVDDTPTPPDSEDKPDTPPIVPDVPPQICTDGELRCQDGDDGASVESCDGGVAWVLQTQCAVAEVCDPAIFQCFEPVCTPAAAMCAADGQGTTFCNNDGSGPIEIEPIPCEDGTWCFDGDKGCVEIACIPGMLGCTTSGALGICDGTVFQPQGDGCENKVCVSCADEGSYVVCQKGTEKAGVDTHPCLGGTVCAPGLGCMPGQCEEGNSLCGLGNTRASCVKAEDGTATWDVTECAVDELCVPLAEFEAECQFDCAADVPCKLGLCNVLPPFGGVDSEWKVPPNPFTLDVVYGLGLTENFKSAFVNLAPIVNPQNGELLSYLQPYIDEDGVTSGHIAVYEDSQQMDITCQPLTGTPYAQLDIVFILDVTGSMSSTIEKVKDSTNALANFLAAKGLDLRFGVVPYTDKAPAEKYQPFLLEGDLAGLVQYVGTLKANGGGDGPENGLDAVMYAAQQLEWRPGAQKVMVLMTDAELHEKGDGTPYSKFDKEEVFGALLNNFVVHTVSSTSSDQPQIGKFLNPRLLSCFTGGTSANLVTFVAADIQDSLFAKALAKSHYCIFNTKDPLGFHDLRVDVHFEHAGNKLFGSTKKVGIKYPIE